MGFLKYIGKELKHAIGEWWYNGGLASLAAFALLFGMALAISAITFVPEHIQQIILIISLVLMGVLLLSSIVLAIWQVIDWLRDKYKAYKEEDNV